MDNIKKMLKEPVNIAFLVVFEALLAIFSSVSVPFLISALASFTCAALVAAFTYIAQFSLSTMKDEKDLYIADNHRAFTDESLITARVKAKAPMRAVKMLKKPSSERDFDKLSHLELVNLKKLLIQEKELSQYLKPQDKPKLLVK